MLISWNNKEIFKTNEKPQNSTNTNIETQLDSFNKLISDTKSFTSFITDIIDIESTEAFPDILKLPRMDFFTRLKSNIINILTIKFTAKIFENEKCTSILTECLRNYEPTYKKYTEKLNNAWDKYQLEMMNKNLTENDNDFENNKYYISSFRKHCINTGNLAIHKCTKNEKGFFIKVEESNSSENKIKYVICENCHKTFNINLFENYCENCEKSYFCSPLDKSENENLLPATNDPPHCENFVNQKLLCENCKGVLYINLITKKIECINKNCLFNIDINEKKEWKCKNCGEKFFSKIKIYNPCEARNFKFIIKKALIYQIKAHPTKLSCSKNCKAVNVKNIEFYHKKDCKGILYFAEANNKRIIICKKCLAINLCKRFIWICPICGVHFRDTKYDESDENKIFKTKNISKTDVINSFYKTGYEYGTYSHRSTKHNLLELISKRKKNEKTRNQNIIQNNNNNKTEDKNEYFKKMKSHDCINEKNDNNDNKDSKYKGRRRYIFNKYMGGQLKTNNYNSSRKETSINDDELEKKFGFKREYYDKKIDDINLQKNKNGIHFKYSISSDQAAIEKNYKKNENKYITPFNYESNEKEENIIDKNDNKNHFNSEKNEIEKNNSLKNKNFIKESKETENDNKIKDAPIKLRYHHRFDLSKNEEKKQENLNNIIRNNIIESWQSKDTTSKGSNKSKNSRSSHSSNSNKNEEKINNNNENKDKNLDDIIEPQLIDFSNDEIEIEDDKVKENEELYENLQQKLKKVLIKGNLPRFNIENYTIVEQIGDGSFGAIYKIYNNKTKIEYAIKKIIANNILALECFQKEFEIVHQNPHPNILDIYGICLKVIDENTFILYVLMDLADLDWEVEINEKAKKKEYYSEKELVSILKQISSALTYLQKEKKIAHRDIKAENVLIFKNNGKKEYKLCDFGEAKETRYSKKHKTLRGTELYMSPLLYNGLLHDEQYVEHDAFKSDVFSLGCCLIIASLLDFDIINEIRELKEQIKIKEFLKNKFEGRYSDKFIDVILEMINFSEEQRMDFIELEQFINEEYP